MDILSEAETRIVSAKEGITAPKDNLARSHEEVILSFPQAHIQFLLNRNDTSATTDHGSACSARPELDLSLLRVQADEDKDTVKAVSDDSLSCDGTIVRGG